MSNQRIIYTSAEGNMCVVVPAPGADMDLVWNKDIPSYAKGHAEVVDVSAIPSDRTFRNAWVKNGKAVEHDFVKAKAIAHEKRRARREILFAPHDAVIMKQIPGKDAAAAEQARADIRQADALVQETINNATDVNQIKSALVAYGALVT
jgi:hypothetical protein